MRLGETACCQGRGCRAADPSNVGVLCDWSPKMRERAGEPLKRTDFAIGSRGVIGEAVVTEKGIERRSDLRAFGFHTEALARDRDAHARFPARSHALCVARPPRRGSEGRQPRQPLAQRGGLSAAQVSLLHEAAFREGKKLAEEGPQGLARRIKACPVPISGMAGLDRAISTAAACGLRR